MYLITPSVGQPLVVRGSAKFAKRVFAKELRVDPAATMESL